jgi:hypothetical protein
LTGFSSEFPLAGSISIRVMNTRSVKCKAELSMAFCFPGAAGIAGVWEFISVGIAGNCVSAM